MAEKLMYRGSVVLGMLALALFLLYAGLTTSNQRLQAKIAQRQGMIDVFSVLGPVNQIMAQSLAEIAVKNNDTAIRNLLTSRGLKIGDTAKGETPRTGDKK